MRSPRQGCGSFPGSNRAQSCICIEEDQAHFGGGRNPGQVWQHFDMPDAIQHEVFARNEPSSSEHFPTKQVRVLFNSTLTKILKRLPAIGVAPAGSDRISQIAAEACVVASQRFRDRHTGRGLAAADLPRKAQQQGIGRHPGGSHISSRQLAPSLCAASCGCVGTHLRCLQFHMIRLFDGCVGQISPSHGPCPALTKSAAALVACSAP